MAALRHASGAESGEAVVAHQGARIVAASALKLAVSMTEGAKRAFTGAVDTLNSHRSGNLLRRHFGCRSVGWPIE